MHIGVIIDGNRRWATKQGLPRCEGHRAGYKNVIKLIRGCLARGVNYLSVYLLAKRNVQERSSEELQDIYGVLQLDFLPELKRLIGEISVHLAGDMSLLPEELRSSLQALHENSLGWEKSLGLLLAIGYSGQDEIMRAIRALGATGADWSKIDEAGFARQLDSGVFPPPDLLIRTGGQQRLSGFLLYGVEYSELFFSSKLWPEFAASDLDAALAFYHGAQRSFGR